MRNLNRITFEVRRKISNLVFKISSLLFSTRHRRPNSDPLSCLIRRLRLHYMPRCFADDGLLLKSNTTRSAWSQMGAAPEPLSPRLSEVCWNAVPQEGWHYIKTLTLSESPSHKKKKIPGSHCPIKVVAETIDLIFCLLHPPTCYSAHQGIICNHSGRLPERTGDVYAPEQMV